jgi:zinc protease
VTLVAESNGGSSKVENGKLPSAMMLPQFVGNFGVGDFDATALRKALAGKRVSLRVALSDLQESISGSSTPKDFETLMQLLYLQFEKPRFDQDAYEATLSRYKAYLTTIANNPQKILSDSLTMILTDHNPRTRLLTPEFADELSFDQMEAIYKDRFADAGDFTFFIVGNVAEDTAKIMAEKYIGSMTNLPRTETWTDRDVHGPKGKTTREIEIPLQVKKATVIINFDAKMPYSPEQNLLLNIFRNILTLRYTDEIREKEGGTYGVRVSASSEKFPKEEKALQLMFDTDPEKAEYLKSIIYREINKIADDGPAAEDLDKAIKNLQKDREQSKSHNNYWLNALTTYYDYGYDPASPENFEDILSKMTASQVQDFAKSLVAKSDVVDVIFKPKAE